MISFSVFSSSSLRGLFFLGFSTDRFIENRSYVFGHSGFAAWIDGTACDVGEIVWLCLFCRSYCFNQMSIKQTFGIIDIESKI
jgi:hypothetical protein